MVNQVTRLLERIGSVFKISSCIHKLMLINLVHIKIGLVSSTLVASTVILIPIKLLQSPAR